MSVDYAREGDLAIITLNRPEKRNALRSEDCQGVTAAVKRAAGRGDATGEGTPARAIVLRGNGPAFCAGADLSGGVYADDFWGSLKDMLQAITAVPIPVIADVQGPAVGAGSQLILACDLRVFGKDATCWIPVAERAFALDAWTHARAKELMGGAVARNVLLGGAKLGAVQAEQVGFAALVGGPEEAIALAQRVAEFAPLSLAYAKRALNSPDPLGLALASEKAELDALFRQVWSSEDVREARAARAEKRKPRFRGR